MPTSRKSTGQGRNRPHIPYRHDDFQHGKRTGMAVNVVDRNSDDFEPFEKIISQADSRTPPRVQGRRKKQAELSTIGDDTNGEMSMDLDMDSNYDSPMAYYKNQRVPVPPSSIHRIGSSSRPVRHSPDVDFDQIPSPRSTALSQRQSKPNGKTPGRSRLSQSFVASLPELDDSSDGGGEFEPFAGPASPEPHHSFTQLDKDGEDEQEEEQIEESILSPERSIHKGKRKSTIGDESTSRYAKHGRKPVPNGHTVDEDEDVSDEEQQLRRKSSSNKRRQSIIDKEVQNGDEEEILQAFNDVDIAYPDSADEEQGSPERRNQLSDIPEEPEEDAVEKPAKKTKKTRKRDENSTEAPSRTRKKPRTVSIARGRTPLASKTSEPHMVRMRSISPENPEGLRRGRRYRYKPLEYWRLEKVVYGRHEDDTVNLVAPIREIIRLPKEEVKPLGGKKSRKWTTAKSKSRTVEPEELKYNPEEGWDDATEPEGHVLDYTTKTEVERRIVYTARMVKPAGSGPFKFQKIFGDGDFIAAGQLVIPVGSEKPSKGTKDNTYVFYVIEGAVNLKIHSTSFVICAGGCFLVPRGNVYYIRNVCSRAAKLFFAQARKIPAGLDESHLLPQPARQSMDGEERSSTVPREKSVGKRGQSTH